MPLFLFGHGFLFWALFFFFCQFSGRSIRPSNDIKGGIVLVLKCWYGFVHKKFEDLSLPVWCDLFLKLCLILGYWGII